MTGHGSKFGRKKEEAIAALLTQRNVEEAARSIGVAPKTLLRWMKLPEFQATYREARPGRMPLTRFSRKAAALRHLSGSAYEAALQNLLRESADEELELFIAESETVAGRLCRLPLSDADLERILAGGSGRECLKPGA